MLPLCDRTKLERGYQFDNYLTVTCFFFTKTQERSHGSIKDPRVIDEATSIQRDVQFPINLRVIVGKCQHRLNPNWSGIRHGECRMPRVERRV